jgi:hypothetical protein
MLTVDEVLNARELREKARVRQTLENVERTLNRDYDMSDNSAYLYVDISSIEKPIVERALRDAGWTVSWPGMGNDGKYSYVYVTIPKEKVEAFEQRVKDAVLSEYSLTAAPTPTIPAVANEEGGSGMERAMTLD